MVLEGPWSIDIAHQDAVQVKVFSNELFKLVDNGHFLNGSGRCGTEGWFWGFTWGMGGGFYTDPRTLRTHLGV